ncbi:VanW family protein [Bacillaceae bacterium IKA-2]|nr:VanW family protein [Bacillaceae bacterium IKA-2]
MALWSKLVILILITIFLVSCSSIREEEQILVASNLIVEMEESVTKSTPSRKPIKLINVHTAQIVYELIPDELGYREGQEAYKKNLVELAKKLARGEDGIDQRMVNPKLLSDRSTTKGKPEIIMREKELVEVLSVLGFYGTEVELPIYIKQPSFTAEEIVDIDKVVIGEYSTRYNAEVAGRSENIRLSAESIEGLILGTGDTFSFNSIVGQRTEARGYKEANVILEGDYVEALGGGICQTSTTLYNAADYSGLTIIERRPHSLPISYVPEGRDAMVSWGTSDLRFRNDYPFPVILKTYITPGQIKIEVRTSKENAKAINDA